MFSKHYFYTFPELPPKFIIILINKFTPVILMSSTQSAPPPIFPFHPYSSTFKLCLPLSFSFLFSLQFFSFFPRVLFLLLSNFLNWYILPEISNCWTEKRKLFLFPNVLYRPLSIKWPICSHSLSVDSIFSKSTPWT